jgi:hypothetical protein
MPGLVPGIHGLAWSEDVDGRDMRAFTPVFDGLMLLKKYLVVIGES